MRPKFISKVKVTKQGQITIPIEARSDLGIMAESELFWYEIDDALVLLKELLNENELQKKMLRKRGQ
ncbi:AbrB/MazE/SpoVT family DNA-binding domain-containing protein [Candidatus Woesearchaeota archaeon]|nr:AbrB/MazE/SpoVT family DNA-binding domain-containing protein [Candidatus Woesearchaeota archaeon]